MSCFMAILRDAMCRHMAPQDEDFLVLDALKATHTRNQSGNFLTGMGGTTSFPAMTFQ
jgi:hypothetical protein